jgi:hypothetical protein
MNALSILAELRKNGATLLASGTSLRVRPGPGGLTEQLREAIRANKPQLIALLETPTHSCERCGRFAYPKPTTCHWCRKAAAAERAA